MPLEKQIAAARTRRENRKLKNFILALGIIQTILFCMSLQYILLIAPSPAALAWLVMMTASILSCLAVGGALPIGGGDKLCK